MGLFKNLFGKTEKNGCCDMRVVEMPSSEEASICSCELPDSSSESMLKLTIMGPGCKKCHQLRENVASAAGMVPAKVQIDYVSDPAVMANTGIVSTPALLVDGAVVSQGKVLSTSDIVDMLKEHGSKAE